MKNVRHGMGSALTIGALTIGALTIGALTGCMGAYEVEYVGPEPIENEPPAPREEVVPQPPYEDAVWVYGYWNWTGVRYVWIPGRYVHRPGPGLYWYPGGYVRRGSTYIYLHGRWGPRGYRPAHRYIYPRRYPPSGGGYYHQRRRR